MQQIEPVQLELPLPPARPVSTHKPCSHHYYYVSPGVRKCETCGDVDDYDPRSYVDEHFHSYANQWL
jgi:hypothetical protein